MLDEFDANCCRWIAAVWLADYGASEQATLTVATNTASGDGMPLAARNPCVDRF